MEIDKERTLPYGRLPLCYFSWPVTLNVDHQR
jgi:hypothetical protein